MSAVIIKIVRKPNAFTSIFVDDRHVGELEDVEGDVRFVIKKLIELLDIDNVKVIVN